MIERKEGDWTVYYDHDGRREILRVQWPPDITPEEIERFVEYLKKLAKDQESSN